MPRISRRACFCALTGPSVRIFARFCAPKRGTNFAAAWLVTGNLKHYPRSGRGGVRVISLAEYLEGLQVS